MDGNRLTIGSLEGAPVELVVGARKTPLFPHEGVLRRTSSFFDTALKKDWEEGQKRIITLPDDEPELIHAYLRWAYSRQVFHAGVDMGRGVLAELYVLGEKLLDDAFQDSVLNAYVARLTASHELPGDTAITNIYEGTPKESPARRLVVNMYVKDGRPGHVETQGENGWEVPTEFKDDLLAALLDKRAFRRQREREFAALEFGALCVYHKHDDREPCPVK